MTFTQNTSLDPNLDLILPFRKEALNFDQLYELDQNQKT